MDAVTFGGHSFTLKRAQDRLICLLSPFFEKRAALTHHSARYPESAAMFALGWLPRPDAEQARTWVSLADGNALNMLAPRVGAAVVDDTDPAAWPSAVELMLASVERPGSSLHARAPLREALLRSRTPLRFHCDAHSNPHRGDPGGEREDQGTSVSENLARALVARLQREGVETHLHLAVEFLREGAPALAAAQAIAAADLFVRDTPLYVDALPALATHALELVAAARSAASGSARFALLVNCGFPEPEQNRTVLQIGAHFARIAGYQWAGGLPLGGGGVVDPSVPLDEQHGPREHIKRALDVAASSLAKGEGVAAEALTAMVQSPFSDAAYRVMGDVGWRYQAWQHGVAQSALRTRPLD